MQAMPTSAKVAVDFFWLTVANLSWLAPLAMILEYRMETQARSLPEFEGGSGREIR